MGWVKRLRVADHEYATAKDKAQRRRRPRPGAGKAWLEPRGSVEEVKPNAPSQ